MCVNGNLCCCCFFHNCNFWIFYLYPSLLFPCERRRTRISGLFKLHIHSSNGRRKWTKCRHIDDNTHAAREFWGNGTNERTPMRCVHIPCSTQQKLLCNCVCTVIIAVILTLLAHTLDRLVLPLSSHSQPILVDAPFFVVFVCLFLFDSSLSLFLFFDLFSSLFFRSLSTTFPSLLSRCRTFLYLLYSTNEHVSNVFDCNHLRRKKKIALCLVLEYFST